MVDASTGMPMRSLAMKGLVCLAAVSLPLLLRAQTMPPLLPGAVHPHLDSLNLSAVLPDSNDAIAVRADSSAAAVLRGETPAARLFSLRRQLFVAQIVAQASLGTIDSTLAFRISNQVPVIGLSTAELAPLSPRSDPIEDAIRHDQLGTSPSFNLGEVLGKGVKYLMNKTSPPRGHTNLWAAIPSTDELSVLKVLWQEGMATDNVIYAQLDSLALTKKDLDAVLERLVARGWLMREIISPQHEFTLLGVLTFEISGRNRKNREYLYWPLIPRTQMLTYLDAAVCSPQNCGAQGDALVVSHLRRLMIMLVNEEVSDRN